MVKNVIEQYPKKRKEKIVSSDENNGEKKTGVRSRNALQPTKRAKNASSPQVLPGGKKEEGVKEWIHFLLPRNNDDLKNGRL